MSFQPGANVYTQGFGNRPESIEVPHIDVRAPTTSDTGQGMYGIGKRWIYTGVAEYVLLSFSASNGVITANWSLVTTSGGDLVQLTGDTGTALPTAAGSIALAGTANQITTAASGSTVTMSLPSAITTPGSLATTTSLTATLGNITATNGNIVRGTAGNKDVYTSVASTTTAGANSAGTVTLVGGTATVSTTAVTASSQIRLYRQGIGATGAAALGILTLGTKSAGVSFVINAVQAADATALQASDVSSIGWEIVN